MKSLSVNRSPFCLAGLLLFLGACLGSRDYSPVISYDLGQARQTGIKLNIGTIDQNGPYNSKMMFRVTPEKIDFKEYQRWTRSPDLLLNDYLKGSFVPDGSYSLEGEILAFENDLVAKKAILTFHYKITKAGHPVTQGLFAGAEKSSQDPDEYAAAMAKLARDLLQEISLKIPKTNP